MVWNKGLTKADPRVAKYVANNKALFKKGHKVTKEWQQAFDEGRIGFKKGYKPYNTGLPPEQQPGYKGGHQKTGNGYIHLLIPNHPFADKRGRVFEHRYILEQQLGRYLEKNERVDHINGNPSDNRIENLRLATHGQNLMNRGRPINNTTGYKNIYLDKKSGKYYVQIGFEGKTYNFGYHSKIEDAIESRNKALKKLHGEFAKLD